MTVPRIPQSLANAGFRKLEVGDPDKFHGFPTWEKDGVRISISNGSLRLSKGAVYRYDDPNEITIQRVIVAPESRRKGRARAALLVILTAAEALGLSVYLEPVLLDKKSDMTLQDLVRFYWSLGFVPDDEECRVMVWRSSKSVAEV
jgi:GNAT superfamily N-acetyltransferase